MVSDDSKDDLVLVIYYLVSILNMNEMSDSNIRRSIRVLQSIQRREGFTLTTQ